MTTITSFYTFNHQIEGNGMLKFYLMLLLAMLLDTLHVTYIIYIIYSQTCSNNNLYKMTTHLRQPTLSLTKQIPIQMLLYKTTTCLMQPATPYLVSQIKKKLSKTTTTKFYPAKKWEINMRQQCIKNKRLSLHLLYYYFLTQSLSIKTEQFIKLCNIDNL